jgi:hypothetical protein
MSSNAPIKNYIMITIIIKVACKSCKYSNYMRSSIRTLQNHKFTAATASHLSEWFPPSDCENTEE